MSDENEPISLAEYLSRKREDEKISFAEFLAEKGGVDYIVEQLQKVSAEHSASLRYATQAMQAATAVIDQLTAIVDRLTAENTTLKGLCATERGIGRGALDVADRMIRKCASVQDANARLKEENDRLWEELKLLAPERFNDSTKPGEVN